MRRFVRLALWSPWPAFSPVRWGATRDLGRPHTHPCPAIESSPILFGGFSRRSRAHNGASIPQRNGPAQPPDPAEPAAAAANNLILHHRRMKIHQWTVTMTSSALPQPPCQTPARPVPDPCPTIASTLRTARPGSVKKSGLSQALAKRSLIRKDLGDARLTVPAFFHSFQMTVCCALAAECT